MNEDQRVPAPTVDPAASAPPVTEAPASQPAPSIDQKEYDFLKEQYANYQRDMQALAPIREDILPMLEDNELVQFTRRSREAYKQLQESQKPAIAPEFAPIYEKVERLDKYVGTLEERDKAAQQNAQQQRAQDQWNKVRKHAGDNPWLAEDNYKAAMEIASFGDLYGIGDFDDAFEAYVGKQKSRFATAAPTPAPPRSLRAEGGGSGVPGTKPSGPINGPDDFRKRLVASLKANRAS